MIKLYNCKQTTLYPPKNFIKYNGHDGYMDSVIVDSCLEKEIKDLWNKGVRTRGCCCGHGKYLGDIVVDKESISIMENLGYFHEICGEEYGEARKDIFISKSYGHQLQSD